VKPLVLSIILLILSISMFSSIVIEQTKGDSSLSVISTPVATQIPLPEKPETLSDIQALLREPDENCQLPCFWGVRPGYTKEEEILEFLQPIAIGKNPPELQYAFREAPDEEATFYIAFGAKDDIVLTTYVVLHNPSEWLPAQTLELPHLLSVMRSTPDAYMTINLSQSRIFLDLFYEEGILANYAFQIRLATGNTIDHTVDNPFILCPSITSTQVIFFQFQDGNIDALFEDNGYQIFVERNKTWPVERMTGMEVEEFVAQIVENPDECIELLSYPDLLEMGYVF
jgi:hypothetical protein